MDKIKSFFGNNSVSDLINATARGDTEAVKKAVNQDSRKLRAVDARHRDITYVAARAGNGELLDFLINEKNVDPCAVNTGQDNLMGSAFHGACAGGHIHIIKGLCEAFPQGMNVKEPLRNCLPIEEAFTYRQFAFIKDLVAKGIVDPRQSNTKNILGLALACYVNGIIDESDQHDKAELEALCLYLINEKKMNPFVDTSGSNMAPIDVFLLPDQAFQSSKEERVERQAKSAADKINTAMHRQICAYFMQQPEDGSANLRKKLLQLAEEMKAKDNEKASSFFRAYAMVETEITASKITKK